MSFELEQPLAGLPPEDPVRVRLPRDANAAPKGPKNRWLPASAPWVAPTPRNEICALWWTRWVVVQVSGIA